MQIDTRHAVRARDVRSRYAGWGSVHVISSEDRYIETQNMQNSVLIPCRKAADAMLNSRSAANT
jgi:hypothetical protein